MHPTRKARRKLPTGINPDPAPASNLEAGSGASAQSEPRLPHERDETASRHGPEPRAITRRAHRDISEGQRDTDCRNAAEETIRRKSGTSLRRKP